jgi:hypothetical protein
VIEVSTGSLDSDVVGRQIDIGVGVVVVLLDVRLEVEGVGDRSEARGQCREDGDGHVIATISDLSAALALRRGHDLGSRLAIRVRNRTLRVAVVCLVLGTSPVLDVVAVALLTLHDAMDGA